jgi:hypothetical protein
MTAKKKKPVKPEKKEPVKVEKKEVDKPEKEKYTPIFPTVTRKKFNAYEVNKFAIKQKLKTVGLDLFKKLKPEKKIEEKKEYEKHPLNDYYQEMNMVILSIWFKFCKLWEEKINGR